MQTGVALGVEVDDKMPPHEYYEYFGPDYTLHVAPSNMENKNTHQVLDDIRAKLLGNLSKLRHAPSVQFQERPPDTEFAEVLCSVKYRNMNIPYLISISHQLLNHLYCSVHSLDFV